MANRYRGEIEVEIGGARRRLVLTLGALAELEDAFGADDLVALAERFGSGRLKARDLVRIIAAGLRGAGESVSNDEVAAMAAFIVSPETSFTTGFTFDLTGGRAVY